MAQGMILTNAGRNLLAKALTGKQLLFTRAAIGNGDLGTRDPKTLTGLIAFKKELPIQSMRTAGTIGSAEVVLEMTNKGMTSGFFVKEYGLFARDPDTNSEILYSYRNMGAEAGYLEGDNGVDIISYTLSIVTVIDQAPNVTAIINNTNQYVTISRLEQRVMDLYANYAEPAGFWTFTDGDSLRIRPATLAQARQALWGTADVAGMNGRLERLEDALNQVILNLEILQGADEKYSHYMAEDFKDSSMLDTFSAAVTSIVAGDDSIDVAPIEGMIPGSLYTVTDGISKEVVQVESINIENGIQRIILTGKVAKTYILPSTQIYRTSARIDSQTAVGATARMKLSWEPTLVWKGTAASETFSVSAETTLNNSKAFTLSGGAVLNSSGLVSLSA